MELIKMLKQTHNCSVQFQWAVKMERQHQEQPLEPKPTRPPFLAPKISSNFTRTSLTLLKTALMMVFPSQSAWLTSKETI